MEPTLDHVLATIDALVASTWPTTEAERIAWFTEHNLHPTRALGDDPEWGTAVPGWGDAAITWSSFEDEFVDVGWFLHPGAGEEVLTAEFAQLATGLAERFGDPVEYSDPDEPLGGVWQDGVHSIQLYAHTEEGDCLQIHVGLTEREEAQAIASGEFGV
ncbi:MAG TPA: hypothetical protein PKN27_08480 [Propionibacteriaceae bacterium]|nr:hypothetical protein [Propionibacteriaceae bacterium]